MRMSSHRSQHGYRATASRALALAACALLAAACGSTAAPGGSGSSGGASSGGASSGGTSTTAHATTSLTVTFAASRTSAAKHYTLTCNPAGGSLPDAAVACGKLAKARNLLEPKPVRVACPMIMASAGRALVTGTYEGHKVHETIVDGGCDLARYQQLRQVFN
jgi:Subtilisin inhibitor-like